MFFAKFCLFTVVPVLRSDGHRTTLQMIIGHRRGSVDMTVYVVGYGRSKYGSGPSVDTGQTQILESK